MLFAFPLCIHMYIQTFTYTCIHTYIYSCYTHEYIQTHTCDYIHKKADVKHYIMCNLLSLTLYHVQLIIINIIPCATYYSLTQTLYHVQLIILSHRHYIMCNLLFSHTDIISRATYYSLTQREFPFIIQTMHTDI